jgi:hypothetical protein
MPATAHAAANMVRRWPTFLSSAGMGEGITLFWVVQLVEITPEPDEEERQAILAALADEEATRSPALPRRDAEDDAP